MACFTPTKSSSEIEQEKRSKQIDQLLKDDKADKKKLKVLLLGIGDAGKSTFSRQLTMIHKGGLPKAEIERFYGILPYNCLTAMKTIIAGASSISGGIDLSPYEESVMAVNNAHVLSPDIAEEIIKLSKTPEITKILDEYENELQIPGGGYGAKYYFEHAKRFAATGYIPTEEDVLRCKVKTSGISETIIESDGRTFILVDVGGQRNERRKWLHCFDCVTTVIFLVAINEYDKVLEEDNETNRMAESISLFQMLSTSAWFSKTSFFLFLNKSDLLREKIKTKPLNNYFEDYDSFEPDKPPADEFEKSCKFIESLYKNVYLGTGRLFTHVTCAVDQDNCKKVFAVIKTTIVELTIDENFGGL